MPQTIYASFADPANAEKAAGALLDYGVRKEDLSVVANERHVWTDRGFSESGRLGGETRGAVLDRSAEARMNDPIYADATDIDTTDRMPAAVADDIDRGDKAEAAAKQGLSTTTGADAGSGAAKGAGSALASAYSPVLHRSPLYQALGRS